jgi:UPF0042 nucleotide-binding protein
MYQQILSDATMNKNQDKHSVIVTGLSGAGKTSVMRALEDLGFYCVDNLPIPLLNTFLHLVVRTQGNPLKVALGLDARGEQFSHDLASEINKLQQGSFKHLVKIMFLNASSNTLLKRFQETRRKHPLASTTDLASAIEKEKNLLEPIMTSADMILDTDTFNIHDLRKWVSNAFSDVQAKELVVNLISFGFKYGAPEESNLVFDVRFLPNPYFVPDLKKLDGRNIRIHEYLFTNNTVVEYWNRLAAFLLYSLQQFYEEDRFFVTIAVGCTGGKHRSVAFVEKIKNENWPNVRFLVNHRDVDKE